uniref:PID domain-containing protein n=1 Tax=Strigamia maritima TaxID=126957 RepID=T1J458_STRMM
MNVNIQRFWKKRSVTITEYDPTFKALYLGNVVTTWAKGEGCADKPLATLWDNYCHSTKTYSSMKVTVTNAGLKAVTKEHGLTEYWANRITFCAAHKNYPKVFCWVYRHEGKKLKQELRCHAVLCTKEENARNMAALLNDKLTQALQEFRREKFCRQKARLSLANCVYDNPSLPRRKILLSTGSANYRPPLERSKSAPKLMAIEEEERSFELDDYQNCLNNNFNGIDLNPSPVSNGFKLGCIDEDNISDESGYMEEINKD